MTPSGATRVAVCADDIGLDDAILRAAQRLAERGRLTGVGCMVGAPAWRQAAAELPGLRRAGIELGLHLDFTEFPLSPTARWPLAGFVVRACARLLPGARLRDEIRRQFDAFERATGSPPDYLDGHQHVHQLPQVRDALAAVLRERGPAYRPWLRSTRRPRGSPIGGKPWVIESLGERGLAQRARALGCAQNGHLLGVYRFDGDAAAYRLRLAGWLSAAVDGDLLMCHPAVAAPPGDGIGAARAWEFEVLNHPALDDALAAMGVVIAPLKAQGVSGQGSPLRS